MIPPQNISCRLHRAARRWPNHVAVIESGAEYTWSDVHERVSRRAGELKEQGLGADCWVLQRAQNTLAGVIDWLAVLRAGARVAPISERLPAAAVKALLAEHGFAALIPEPGAALQLTGVAATAQCAGSLRLHFDPAGPCAGVATSGSTGTPRIAVHSYGNYVRSAQGAIDYLPLSPQDRYLLSLPLFHVGGLGILFRCMESGAGMVLGGRAEDPDFLRARQVSHVSMVETQLRRLLEHDRLDLPALHCLLLGGGPVADDLLHQALKACLPCYMSYGLTEMSSQVATWPAVGGAGRVLKYRELRVEDGEIQVRGQTLCIGYLHEGKIVPLKTLQGWFATRDLGQWQEGRLTIKGRRDNQFISGGENIQPEAIEATLCSHPLVREAVIVPRKDREFGQRPVAFVNATGNVDFCALRQWLRGRLSPYMTPVDWHLLPPGEGLKQSRSRLRELAEQLHSASDETGADVNSRSGQAKD